MPKKKLLRPFYVYALVDPRKNGIEGIFYIGKGKGQRLHQHRREAHSESVKEIESRKLECIREVNASGHEIIEKVIGRYSTEVEAYAVEATLIRWVYGLEDLSNITLGRHSASIRKKSDGFETDVPNVDIRPSERINDGSFTAGMMNSNMRNRVEERLNVLKACLTQIVVTQPEIARCVVFEDVDVRLLPKDPSLFVQLDNKCRLQFLLRSAPSRAGYIPYALKPMIFKKVEAQKFVEFIDGLNLGWRWRNVGKSDVYIRPDKRWQQYPLKPMIDDWWELEPSEIPQSLVAACYGGILDALTSLRLV